MATVLIPAPVPIADSTTVLAGGAAAVVAAADVLSVISVIVDITVSLSGRCRICSSSR
jgi:hypothetical protein